MSLLLMDSDGSRPSPVQQPAIAPPWDPSYPDQEVHTTPPPGWAPVIDRLWPLGNFGGIELPVDQTPPFIPGANTTPLNSMISFFLPYYDVLPGGRQITDNWLTASAQRSFRNVHLSASDLLTAKPNVNDAADYVAYLCSWGNFVSYWATSKGQPRQSWASIKDYVTDLYRALLARNLGDKIVPIIGTEINADCSPEQAQDLADGMYGLMNPDGNYPFWHFTPWYAAYQRNDEPESAFWPRQAGKSWGLWAQTGIYLSVPNDYTSEWFIGKMGGKLYSMRQIVAAGGDFRFVLGECTATGQLYGCREIIARRYATELLWCTVEPGLNVPNMSGCADGGPSYADGTPFLVP